jgi:hypothetical protein
VSSQGSSQRGLAWRLLVRPAGRLIGLAATAVFLVVAFPLALVSRLSRRTVDVGLGPEPLINNVYHKRALARYGYSAETFVDQVYYITQEFDYRGDLKVPRLLGWLRAYVLFTRAVFRYKALYIYFNGGPLMSRRLAWRLEPALYRVAGVKVVVMPYGGDVQVMSRSRNLLFKDAQSRDYPIFRRRHRRVAAQVDLWTRWADHVISGVEWVDYMYHWDTLMLGHFSIDVRQWEAKAPARSAEGPLRLLHAPNHRAIKGTRYFVRAVEELRAEGVDVELEMRERVSNDEIREAMDGVDIVADQLVVGWYAMFALEALAMGKPVLCYLRRDLLSLYTAAGLIEEGEIPIVNCEPLTVKDAIRHLAENREVLPELGRRGREFVRRHHSLDSVGQVFDRINRGLGLSPSGPPAEG